ncbi:hypothetical protein JCGZ_03664 [Jatropha curcas]|uniref:Uncharacterized protein n=1 Tax=Jatropha curcas TaxID=180498 RepID=A0A067JCI9_JATCU|nr:hypothetical protein JCGZ_03664 [Jatropha curcas]
MGDGSIPTFELKKMIERIVISSLEKLLHSDKGKEHVNIKYDEKKGELEKKEQANETWQDEESFTKKVTNKNSESEWSADSCSGASHYTPQASGSRHFIIDPPLLALFQSGTFRIKERPNATTCGAHHTYVVHHFTCGTRHFI